jgi:ribosomal protein L13
MNSLNKTFYQRKITKIVIGLLSIVKDKKLGRLATIIVTLLKVKPHYYPSIDTGDYIILINADLIVINEKLSIILLLTQEPGHSLK